MKIKYFLAGLLCVCLVTSMMTACANPQSAQSSEAQEGKTAYQTTDLKYSADLMGKVYKIDLSVEPSTDPGTMKTKHRYSAGNWSDYQQK